MKTITEYQPMIFSRLAVRAGHVSDRRRRLGIDLLAAVGYGSLGLWLSCDTGFAPWQWQFWLMFAPLFMAGELAWRVWQRVPRARSQEPSGAPATRTWLSLLGSWH